MISNLSLNFLHSLVRICTSLFDRIIRFRNTLHQFWPPRYYELSSKQNNLVVSTNNLTHNPKDLLCLIFFLFFFSLFPCLHQSFPLFICFSLFPCLCVNLMSRKSRNYPHGQICSPLAHKRVINKESCSEGQK